MEPIELRSPVTLGAQRQRKLPGAQVVPGAQTMNCNFAQISIQLLRTRPFLMKNAAAGTAAENCHEKTCFRQRKAKSLGTGASPRYPR